MPIFLLDRRPILRRLGGSKGVFTEVWQGHNDGMVERIRSIGFFCFIFRTVEFWNSWVVLFFSLKWKNKKMERASWAKPPELLDAKDGQLQTSQPPLRLPQRITQVSCGWRHSVGIATGFPDVFGGSACIFVKHGEHLWHAQAGTCNCLNARYFFWLIPQMYLEVQLAICNKHLNHSTRGIAKDNWRSKFRTPNQNQSKISKVLGLDCFIISEWKYWLVFPINYENTGWLYLCFHLCLAWLPTVPQFIDIL